MRLTHRPLRRCLCMLAVTTSVVVTAPAAEAGAAMAEPGDDFASALVIPTPQAPGFWSATDELLPTASGPDLFLGVFDGGGINTQTNDDDSRLGDGLAPELIGVPVNAGGAIDFAVTGFGDDLFVGDHLESGSYTVGVTIYEPTGGPVQVVDEFFFDSEFLEPEDVDRFGSTNPAWEDALYDVIVNNTPGGNDVDFYRFTGLTPGEEFLAQTGLPSGSGGQGGVTDTLLAWFDESGQPLAVNDDRGQSLESLLRGVVPPSGEVVLAVSGFGDDNFDGTHGVIGAYTIDVIVGPLVEGDYDGSGTVDSSDYADWFFSFGRTGPGQVPDGNDNGVVDAADYTIWRDAIQASSPASVVPEPAAACLAAISLGAFGRRRG
ncbi:MAG: hypothetical protein AAF805_03800 [Planctomycetota bacterium]